MGDIVFLAAGYAVFLLVIFILVFSIARRQRKVQADLDMVEQLVRDEAGLAAPDEL